AEHHWRGRTARAFPYADLLAAGARLEIGSDAPVAPLDPWDGIASAVARTDDDRPPFHAQPALPLPAALAAAPGGRPAVRPGDPADLVLTAADPAETPPADLRSMPVLLTLLAGRPTFRAAGLDRCPRRAPASAPDGGLGVLAAGPAPGPPRRSVPVQGAGE